MKKVVTNNFEETRKLGAALARKLQGGEVIALYGDLGAGKTTFMQGLAEGLGVKRRIISPTFIIMRTYELGVRNPAEGEARHGRQEPGTKGERGIRNLYHVDLYRIESERDVEGLGLLELLGDKENIVAIEWPDKIENVLPEKRIDIYFEYLGDDQRSITSSSF